MGLFDFIKKTLQIYDLDSLEGIQQIPNKQNIMQYAQNGSLSGSILSDLQKKATEHKKHGNMELSIACLEKSFLIMLNSDYYWSPYADRYVNYLKNDRQFDKAREVQKKIDTLRLSCNSISELDLAIKNAKSLKTDLLEADFPKPTDSKTAMYRGRIFSISGKDKHFPKLPDDISETELMLTPFIFGVSEATYCKPGKEIEFSNKPFKDTRSSKEKAEYNEMVQKSQEAENNRIEYDWIWENLPDIAPKSLSGYVRMKNSNSKNFQNLVKKAQECGYLIKTKH